MQYINPTMFVGIMWRNDDIYSVLLLRKIKEELVFLWNSLGLRSFNVMQISLYTYKCTRGVCQGK